MGHRNEATLAAVIRQAVPVRAREARDRLQPMAAAGAGR